MEPDQIPVDKAKVQALIAFLSERMLVLPEYDENKKNAEEEIIELDNLSQAQTMSAAERDRHNGRLQNLEVPDNLFL